MMDKLKLTALWSSDQNPSRNPSLIPSPVALMRPMKGPSQRSLKLMNWQKMQYHILSAMSIKFFTRTCEGCVLAKMPLHITKGTSAKFGS